MASASDIYVKLQKLSNQATKTTLNYNREEANTARTWQKQMSDTSHQREVRDLIKAGLNPVLSSGGNGAQSYTTSAASGQAENAANAVASAYGADQSAAATRYAAQQSAAATRAAAAANVRAAQIAAAANMYNADQHLKGVQYQTKFSKSGSPFGVLDNLMRRENASNTSFLAGLKTSVKDMNNNPSKYFSSRADTRGHTLDTMNWRGKQVIQSFLRKYNIGVSRPNQQIAFDALVLGKKSALNTISYWVDKYNESANRAAKRFSNYRGMI